MIANTCVVSRYKMVAVGVVGFVYFKFKFINGII